LSKFTYNIEKNIGILSTSAKGWKKELNLVSWNGLPAKYDLREWDGTYSKMGKGITLSEEEVKLLYESLKIMFENPSNEDVGSKKENLENQVAKWELQSPLFIRELTSCVKYANQQGCSYEQIQQLLLGKQLEDIEENIMNEIESISTIYFAIFEEFKDVLKNINAEELSLFLSK